MINSIVMQVIGNEWTHREKELFKFLSKERIEKAFSFVHIVDQKTCVYAA